MRVIMRTGALQWVALTVLIASMFSASKRAAVPAIMAIVKFFWPLLIVWIVWRFIRARVTGAVQAFQRQVMDAAQQGGYSGGTPGGMRGPKPSSGQGQVLDLCPKCGTLLAGNHHCS